MNKRDKIIFYSATGILSALILLGVGMYFFAHDQAVASFNHLGFPTFIIYPLGIAKTLGLIAIWTNKSKMLTEWAYAGFTFNLLLAISAHMSIGDGEQFGAILALLFTATSYIFYRRLESQKAQS